MSGPNSSLATRFWSPLPAAKPSQTFELHEVPHCWGRSIERTAGWVAIILGPVLAILGVGLLVIGFGWTQDVCSPWQDIDPGAVFHVVAPIENAARLCQANPNRDIGLLVIGLGLSLLLVGLILIAVGGLAVFFRL